MNSAPRPRRGSNGITVAPPDPGRRDGSSGGGDKSACSRLGGAFAGTGGGRAFLPRPIRLRGGECPGPANGCDLKPETPQPPQKALPVGGLPLSAPLYMVCFNPPGFDPP